MFKWDPVDNKCVKYSRNFVFEAFPCIAEMSNVSESGHNENVEDHTLTGRRVNPCRADARPLKGAHMVDVWS